MEGRFVLMHKENGTIYIGNHYRHLYEIEGEGYYWYMISDEELHTFYEWIGDYD